MGDQDGSGRVFTHENVQEGSGEIAWNGNIRTNSHTPEIGSPTLDLRPTRPPLTRRAPALYPLPASGRMASPLRDGRQEDPLLFQLVERLWREQLTMREDIHTLAERLHAAHACEP